jgi:TatD DNase family protein
VIDSHCHLADAAFAVDLDAVVERARAAGIDEALCILSAGDPVERERIGIIRAAWAGVRFAVAVHPHRAGRYQGRPDDAIEQVRAGLAASAAVAIGEIGLDYHYDFAPPEVQRDIFAAQLLLARQLGLPIVIHTREAFDDTLAVVRETAPGIAGVLHCFTGTLEEARRGLDAGLHVSLAGIVTFPKAASLRELAAFVPEDRLLVETDAPYLAPVPYRGKRNEPAWVLETLAAVAAARGDTPAVVGAAIMRNFRALFDAGRPQRVDTSVTSMV